MNFHPLAESLAPAALFLAKHQIYNHVILITIYFSATEETPHLHPRKFNQGPES